LHTKPAKPVYATIAGFCLIAIGLCLTRYAYTPLIPSLIDAKWVTKPGAGYLGAFNCLGYIISCLIAIWMPRLTGVRLLMRLALVLAVVGLAMCAWDLGFIWLALGRFMAGLGGAVLVIHTPAVMLQGIGDRAKGICSGIAFSGAGITIILVSLLLPLFIVNGPRNGWLFEAGLTLIMAVAAWRLISTAPRERKSTAKSHEPLDRDRRLLLILIAVAYVLAAIGVTPHTLFLSDYMHRDLGLSIARSSSLFAIVGAGCAVGAMTSGLAGKFLGTRLSQFLNYLIGTIAVAMVLLFDSILLVTASAFIIGLFLLQCVPLTSLRTLEVVGISRHPRYWGFMTLCFGLGLVIGSYGMSGLLSLKYDYIDLFRVAQVALAVALCLVMVSWWRFRKLDCTASHQRATN
jgi:predicted MFS family arabinose efflux permease